MFRCNTYMINSKETLQHEKPRWATGDNEFLCVRMTLHSIAQVPLTLFKFFLQNLTSQLNQSYSSELQSFKPNQMFMLVLSYIKCHSVSFVFISLSYFHSRRSLYTFILHI